MPPKEAIEIVASPVPQTALTRRKTYGHHYRRLVNHDRCDYRSSLRRWRGFRRWLGCRFRRFTRGLGLLIGAFHRRLGGRRRRSVAQVIQLEIGNNVVFL